MLELAFGEMDMTPHEYYTMTRAEFILKAKGYQRKEAKVSWHVREMVYGIYATQFGRKKPMPSKSKFWPNILDNLNPDLSVQEKIEVWKRLKSN